MSMLSNSVLHQVRPGDPSDAVLLITEVNCELEKLSTRERDILLFKSTRTMAHLNAKALSKYRSTVR